MNRDRLIAFLSGVGLIIAISLIAAPFVWAQVSDDLAAAEEQNAEYQAQVTRLEADLAEVVLAPILDPVAAYCRGVNDGFTIFGVHNGPALAAAGILYQEPTVDQLAEADANCYEGVTAGVVLPGGRGPLLADE